MPCLGWISQGEREPGLRPAAPRIAIPHCMSHHPAAMRFLLGITLLLAVWGFFLDVRNTSQGGSVDLRNRVTGSRVADAGMDPFTFKWSPERPPEFCDPYNHAGWPYSKTTVSPLALAIHAPFNGWNYQSIQWLWFFFQYACLAAGFLAWNRCDSGREKIWGAIFTTAFCATAVWRLHVDRGQIYVLYAALLPVVAWLAGGEGRAKRFIGGLAGTFLIGLRPVFFGQFAPPLFRKRWMFFVGVATGSLLLFFLPKFLYGPEIWGDYRSGMEGHASLYLEQAKPVRAPIAYPDSIEDIPIDKLARFARIPFADSSVFGLISFGLSSKTLLIGWALLMLCAGVVMMRRPHTGDAMLWWAISAWILIGDFLLPAYRNPYNDILIWPLFLFGLGALKGAARKLWIALCGLWLLAALAVWVLPKEFIPIPSILGWLIAAGVAAFSLLPPRGQ